jgi:membrane peptidoglycan carboxypeptidase
MTNLTGYTTCNGSSVTYPHVQNAEPGAGSSYNLETGTWYSVNTFFAQLEQRTGLCVPVKLAEAMGVRQGTGAPPQQYPSFVLGSGGKYGFTPLDLAGAYATMAAHGKYCKPIAITKIVDRSGNTYPVPKAHCQQVVPVGLANTITSILEGVLTKPGATGTADVLSGRPAAAKTGTVDNYQGSWFAGYTPQLASAVWAGIPSHPNESLAGKTIGGTYYATVFGATLAGRIWQSTMNAALQGAPVEQFTGASSYYEIGVTTSVPNVVGQNPGDAEAALIQAGFHPQIVPGAVHSTEKLGTVARTSPAAGASASTGAVISVYISNGTPAPSPTASRSAPPSAPPSAPAASPPAKPHGHRHHPHHHRGHPHHP